MVCVVISACQQERQTAQSRRRRGGGGLRWWCCLSRCSKWRWQRWMEPKVSERSRWATAPTYPCSTAALSSRSIFTFVSRFAHLCCISALHSQSAEKSSDETVQRNPTSCLSFKKAVTIQGTLCVLLFNLLFYYKNTFIPILLISFNLQTYLLSLLSVLTSAGLSYPWRPRSSSARCNYWQINSHICILLVSFMRSIPLGLTVRRSCRGWRSAS